ncbi:MAG: gp53-like domain-containing protein, partial [Methylobacter sp.]
INLVVSSSHAFKWLVRNETTGAFAITVKTASGAGVVVAQSADTPVWTDGADVRYDSSVIPQAEAEAGTATTKRGWSAQRVKQAINAVVKAATETISGIAEIATQAEVNAGTDDTRIVSPAKLRYGFSILLATNGYVVFAAHQYGLIIQWGNAQFAGVSTLTVTLPIQYPNNNFTVIPSNLSAAVSCALSSKTTSTFGLSASTTNSGSCGWVSFGN